MSKISASKSREFKEKERKAREGLRLSIERDLVGDMIRLLDDKLYCDVTFIIEEQDFPAHVAILYARAPVFSQNFLPQLLTPSAVQSCIYIQNVKPEEFSTFLRSVYTENEVQDYSKTEYPWTEKVSWYYPNEESPALQHEICNGLEDSIEDSQIVDQTFQVKLNEGSKEDLKLEKWDTHSPCQSCENKSELSTFLVTNGYQKENDICNLEEQENECENVIESLEYSFKDKEEKRTDTLKGKELDVIALEACSKMGQELVSLVDDSKTGDITFIVNNNKRIKAHRSILCTRSSYFSAMLYGGWSESQAMEIPLFGMNSSRAFLVVLYYLYGGITRIPLDITDICEVLRLSDMYGLEGLREVVICQFKIEKCHLFHKPCPECIAGVIDCLDVSDLFQLSDLKSQSLKWIAKYFDRVYGTKCFASLNKALHDESLAFIQSTMNSSNVLDLLSRGEKLSSSIPLIKWAEPVLTLVASHIDFCLSFIASKFPVIARQQTFLDMLKGVGWSTPLLEKIFTAVRKNWTIQNCCEKLKEAKRLRNLLSAENEDCEERYFEESYKLVDSLHSRCQEFIVSNLHRVSHTEGWRRLSPRTQNEVRKSKGGMFVDIGLPRQTNKPRLPSKKSEKNPPFRNTPSNELVTRVRPQGAFGSSSRTEKSVQGATSSRQKTAMERPASAQRSVGKHSGSRLTDVGSSGHTQRNVQSATSSRQGSAMQRSTSAKSLLNESSGSRSTDGCSSSRIQRSVQGATSSRQGSAMQRSTSAKSLLGESSGSRSTDGCSSSRTQRSVQGATSIRNGPAMQRSTSAKSLLGESSGSRLTDVGSSGHTQRNVQSATSSRQGSAMQRSTSAKSLLGESSGSRSTDGCSSSRTQRSVQGATSIRHGPAMQRSTSAKSLLDESSGSKSTDGGSSSRTQRSGLSATSSRQGSAMQRSTSAKSLLDEPSGSRSTDGGSSSRTQRSVQGATSSRQRSAMQRSTSAKSLLDESSGSRSTDGGSSSRTQRSVQGATSSRHGPAMQRSTSAKSLLGESSGSRSTDGGSSSRTQRSVQGATSSRQRSAMQRSTSAKSLLDESSGSRSTDGGSSSRTQRSVQGATSSRHGPAMQRSTSAKSSLDESSGSRSTDGGSSSRTQRSVQGATSSRHGPAMQRSTSAKSSLDESSGSRSADASRSSSACGAIPRNSTKERPGNTANNGKRNLKEPQKNRKLQFSSLTTNNRNLPSTSGSVTGKEGKDRLNASASQKRPPRNPSSKSRSADSKTSTSISTNTSNEKNKASSNLVAHSSTHPGGSPCGFNRSYSDVNRTKLVDIDASEKKCLSELAISERRRKNEETFIFNKNEQHGPKTRGSTSRKGKEYTSSTQRRRSTTDVSRVKLARESVVGPVRLAQKNRPQNKSGSKGLSTKSNSDHEENINQTFTIINVNRQDEVKKSRDLVMTETEASPLQQDFSSSSSIQESRVSSELVQDNDPMMTETEASLSQDHSSSSIQESRVSSELVQDNDSRMTETEASLSQDHSSSSIQESSVSSELVQDNDSRMTETEASASQQDCSLSSSIQESRLSSELLQDNDLMVTETEASLSQDHSSSIQESRVSSELVQDNDSRMTETEASLSQDHSSSSIQESRVSSELVQDNDLMMTETEASLSQDHSSSSIQESRVSSELVQDNDPMMTETQASPSQQDCSLSSPPQEFRVSSELVVQDNDPMMKERDASLSQQDNSLSTSIQESRVSSELVVQDNDLMVIQTEASPSQQNSSLTSSIQESRVSSDLV